MKKIITHGSVREELTSGISLQGERGTVTGFMQSLQSWTDTERIDKKIVKLTDVYVEIMLNISESSAPLHCNCSSVQQSSYLLPLQIATCV